MSVLSNKIHESLISPRGIKFLMEDLKFMVKTKMKFLTQDSMDSPALTSITVLKVELRIMWAKDVKLKLES